jgi:hypothetical protein
MKIALLSLLLLVSCSSSKKAKKVSSVEQMSPKTVRYVISSNFQNFKGCYDRLPKKSRQFVKMNWMVDKKGNVFNSNVSSNTKHKVLEACLKTILDGMTFPEPREAETASGKQSITFVPSFKRS